MKRYTINILGALLLTMMGMNALAQTSWDFTTVSSADQSLLAADESGNWMKDSKNRWCHVKALANAPLTANGTELDFGKGLLFSCNANENGNLRLGEGRLWVGNASCPIVIPALKKGQTVSVRYKTSSNGTARHFTPSNLEETSGFDDSASEQTATGKVAADGDVTLTPSAGLYVYELIVGAIPGATEVIPGGETTLYQDVSANAVKRDASANQMQVTLKDGSIKYYNTNTLSAVDIDKEASTVTIAPLSGNSDIYYGSVNHISFAKGVSSGENATIDNHGVIITESKGWFESAYVKWAPYQDATTYKVYIKGGNYSDYTLLDNMLVRDYGSYGRADMVGLVAGTNYELKVVPVVNDNEMETAASFARNIKVVNYNRAGFAHKDYAQGVGAYNNDGSLKSGAKVLYVTKNTAKTVKCNVITSEKGAVTECVGLQEILDAYQKGYDTTPLAIRLIGKISLEDLDHISSSAEGLQVKGNKANSVLNTTIEGIGEDATISGFGFLIRNACSVELRNFAIMLFLDDGVSMDTDNSHIWAHNLDLFYGKKGKDSDQIKGDGSIDIKSNSKLITTSFCHFWDSGKASLCGMDSESGPNYITYHHNWFDHSDSRHPRIRTMSVHVWNNYFDGVAKYGVGATTGSSAFVEANYFRTTKYPMLISMQGSDMIGGKGTFSSEDGGIIKSFANVFAEKDKNFSYVTYQQNPTEFDAWEATNRNDQVPSSVKSKKGSHTYDNFDTNSTLMYTYEPEAAADVPSTVEGWYGAGRMNHGDFTWTFTSEDDQDYELNEELKAALQNYTSSLVGIFGGETISGGGTGGDDIGGGDDTGGGETGTTIDADVVCTFSKTGPSSSLFTVNGSYSNSKGSVTVNGETLNWCLKLESSTLVSFTTTVPMTMTLVFGPSETANILVDGVLKTDSSNTLTMELPAGDHTLKKKDTRNLFYIGLKTISD